MIIRHWTTEEDALLRRRVRVDGWTFARIAAEFGRTRCACIGRWHRIKRRVA